MTIAQLRSLLLTVALLVCAAPASAAQTPSPFHDWTVAIVAGDWRTGQGQPIQAFDNAVRDLAAGFERAGFEPDAMAVISLRPDVADPVTAEQAIAAISEVAERARGGCLFYLTSHGSPQGAVFGPDQILSPERLSELIDGWCADRPTVVVVSTCYSGVFTPALAHRNRIIITAARHDRSSFGCGEEATYPYFDGCILEALPTSADFIGLAHTARTCVARREREEWLSPASEPQISIGSDMQLRGPVLRFSRTPD